MWAQKYIATYRVCMYRKESEKWLGLEEKQGSELLDWTPLEPITGKRKQRQQLYAGENYFFGEKKNYYNSLEHERN